MRILIVALDFKPNVGGIAEFTHQLAHHWQLRGDDVMVLCPSGDVQNAADFDSHAPYRVKRSPALGKERRARPVLSALKKAIGEHSPDVILNNSAYDLASVCWCASVATKVPFCVLAHGREVNRRLRWRGRLKQWVALRGAARVFCNSSYTAKAAMSRGSRIERIAVVNPGFSLQTVEMPTAEQCSAAKQQLGWEGRRVLLTIGRLIERKGNDTIIEALPLVQKAVPEVLYVIVGSGPRREALGKRVQDLGLGDHVRFAGWVPDEDKAMYYRASDVFAMPNREMPDGDVEGFGMVFLEANAYGKPVIGGRSGGVVDAVDHGRSGFLVDPLDVEGVAATIIQLLRDEQLSRQMGEWGRERVLKEFGWEVVAARMRDGLTDVVRGDVHHKETE